MSSVDSKFHPLYPTHVPRQYTLSPYISIFYNGSLYIPLYYYYIIYFSTNSTTVHFLFTFYFPDEKVGGQKREMMTSAFI
jgi:hypothetical protein